MKKAILITITTMLLAAALAPAAPLAAETSELPPGQEELEYAVYVDALNLRAEPGMDAKIITVLKAGDVVAHDRFRVEHAEADGVYWIKVRAAGGEGWLDYEYITPRYIYDAYREASRLGKAGDTAGMVTAIKAAAAGLGQGTDDVVPSADGRKVIVGTLADVTYNPYFGDIGTLYFETGKGLVYSGFDLEAEGVWSADSRYFAYVESYYDDSAGFFLFDTVTGVGKRLGSTYDAASIEGVDGYFIWLDFKLTGDYVEPWLAAYELATGETVVLLQADVTTLRDGAHGGHEVKLVPVGDAPAVLRASDLFKEYDGAYVARDEEGV
jgi:hypothetical protein